MPCAMMHLECAMLYDKNADISFFVGNESPDCMDIREIKDKSHFRIYTHDREEKFLEFVRTLDTRDPYLLGVVLHLYADMLWDAGPMKRHKESYTGDNWFMDYRRQIRLIGTHLYKNREWAADLWAEMCNVPESKYDTLELFPAEKIKSYLIYNRDRSRVDETTPSPDFPPEMVDEFCVRTVESFRQWLDDNNIAH